MSTCLHVLVTVGLTEVDADSCMHARHHLFICNLPQETREVSRNPVRILHTTSR